jgi:hypothetical protein
MWRLFGEPVRALETSILPPAPVAALVCKLVSPGTRKPVNRPNTPQEVMGGKNGAWWCFVIWITCTRFVRRQADEPPTT